MAARNKIEQMGLANRILELDGNGKGETGASIAAIINEELAGTATISQPTVSRWLKSVRKDRSEQTRDIVQKHLQVQLPKDLDALEEIQSFLFGIFRNVKAGESGEEIPAEYSEKDRTEAGMKAVKIIETKLRNAGVLEEPPDSDPDLNEDERALLKDLAELRAVEARKYDA